jgi:hypothetical protein
MKGAVLVTAATPSVEAVTIKSPGRRVPLPEASRRVTVTDALASTLIPLDPFIFFIRSLRLAETVARSLRATVRTAFVLSKYRYLMAMKSGKLPAATGDPATGVSTPVVPFNVNSETLADWSLPA